VELDLEVRIADLCCVSIAGRFRRFTTPECPRALELLQEARGFCLTEEVTAKIKKTLDRRACHHFANLLIDCGYAAREATKILRWEGRDPAAKDQSLAEFLGGEPASSGASAPAARVVSHASAAAAAPGVPPPQENADKGVPAGRQGAAAGGFFVDLHVHTSPASPCASSSVEAVIEAAKGIGLDALCLTDHNHVWNPQQVAELSRQSGLLVLRGNEIVTDQGDMLVFGFDEEVRGIIRLAELKARVAAAGGVVLAAHPFRGFLTFGAGELGLSVEQAASRDTFRWVDGLETQNGKVTSTENGLAGQVAERLELTASGGSDAHHASMVGCYATRFDEPIHSEADLIAALRAGRCQPVAFRRERGLA
ncbi:MAG TPA: PHP domain-containing protein, partial [Deferrisomatales bacterium]|nr:PHP domain-containing protein [Deferrisomatales bacterium]